MCTVTAVPLRFRAARGDRPVPGDVRIICNRDEQRGHARALPPRRCTVGARTAIMPIDPQSGGTWIAVNDAGLAVCLLNANPATTRDEPASLPPRTLRSRGEIVPRLAACLTLDESTRVIADFDPRPFPPFRLLLIRHGWFLTAEADGRGVAYRDPAPLNAPIMLTSSALGDALVEPPRRALFRHLMSGSLDPIIAQRRFHAHSWPELSHLSVLMSRSDARTVSRTTIDLHAAARETERGAVMRYRSFDDPPRCGTRSRTCSIRPGVPKSIA